MAFVFAPAPPASVPVQGEALRFAVRRIFCVGRNYAEHAREMGHDPDREPPFFFGKPTDSLLTDGAPLPYPPLTEDLHYEGELVVALGKGGRNIALEDAMTHVWGYGCGNDFTRRDLQSVAKKMGRPWDMAKGFDHSAACGALVRKSEGAGELTGTIRSYVNGELRQEGQLEQMIWSVPEVIVALSALVELCPGDLIYTGTPAGVGKIEVGDVVKVEIEGLPVLVSQVR